MQIMQTNEKASSGPASPTTSPSSDISLKTGLLYGIKMTFSLEFLLKAVSEMQKETLTLFQNQAFLHRD